MPSRTERSRLDSDPIVGVVAIVASSVPSTARSIDDVAFVSKPSIPAAVRQGPYIWNTPAPQPGNIRSVSVWLAFYTTFPAPLPNVFCTQLRITWISGPFSCTMPSTLDVSFRCVADGVIVTSWPSFLDRPTPPTDDFLRHQFGHIHRHQSGSVWCFLTHTNPHTRVIVRRDCVKQCNEPQ